MRTSTIAAAVTSLLVATTTIGTVTPAVAAPATASIDVLNVNGSGCRQGTVAVALSADRTAFTVIYSSYLAQVGGAAKVKEASKNCRLNLRINTPAGHSPAISQIDHRGYAELTAGATAVQTASYRFHGADTVTAAPRTLTGEYADYWQGTDRTPGHALIFGACGKSRNVDLDTALSVRAGTPDGAVSFIAMDSMDGVALATTYRLAWRACA